MDEIQAATRRWQDQRRREWGCDWCGARSEELERESGGWCDWVSILNTWDEAVAAYCPACTSVYMDSRSTPTGTPPMDEIKEEGLRNLLCQDCVETRRYHLRGEKNESWWCPHAKVLVCWLEAVEPHVFTLLHIDDTKYFTMLAEGWNGWQQMQAGKNN